MHSNFSATTCRRTTYIRPCASSFPNAIGTLKPVLPLFGIVENDDWIPLSEIPGNNEINPPRADEEDAIVYKFQGRTNPDVQFRVRILVDQIVGNDMVKATAEVDDEFDTRSVVDSTSVNEVSVPPLEDIDGENLEVTPGYNSADIQSNLDNSFDTASNSSVRARLPPIRPSIVSAPSLPTPTAARLRSQDSSVKFQVFACGLYS